MSLFTLTKTLTAAGNSFGFSGTAIVIAFDEGVTKVTEDNNKIYGANIQRPYSRGDYASYPPKTMLVDLKQVKTLWTITGVLTNDMDQTLTGVSPSTTASAINKKNLIRAFAEQGGDMILNTRTAISGGIYVNIVRFTIDDEETEVGSDSSETMMHNTERRLSYTLILQEGIDR